MRGVALSAESYVDDGVAGDRELHVQRPIEVRVIADRDGLARVDLTVHSIRSTKAIAANRRKSESPTNDNGRIGSELTAVMCR